MRVIAGKYRHIVLDALEGDHTRPTKDMVKEALFSSLGSFNGSETFLDLFGGSGGMGIEACSRGAKRVVINDGFREAYEIIKKNVNKVQAPIAVYNLDYTDCIKSLANQKFDYIFLDPPYKFNEFDKIFSLFNEYGLLKDDSIVIFETDKHSKIADCYCDFKEYKTKKYGISVLHYYNKEKEGL